MTTLQPQLRFLAPYQTVCNYWNYFFTFLGETVSQSGPFGYSQRAAIKSTGQQSNNPSSMGAAEPGNGEGYSAASASRGAPANFHGQSYTPAIGPGGEADCENGQRGYIRRLARFSDPKYDIVSDPETPGLSGPTYRGRPRVPRGQSFVYRPETGRPGGAMRQRGMPPFKAGLIAIVVIAVGTYFAFSKELPFRSHYEISAVFRSRQQRQAAPARADRRSRRGAGGGHPAPRARQVARRSITMRIKDDGRPVHRDARVKIRPRLFLEGNWLIDLEPGTPDTKEIPDGGTIPIQQTSNPVQLGQVLTALQSDTRKNLQTLFREYSSALEGEGADGFRRSIRHWKGAYRDSALVQEATLGLGEHDLSDYIDGAGRVARGLDRNPAQLKALVTDFDTAAGAFAREAGSLEQAIAELPRTLRTARPALGELNRSLPPLRRFARDLQPSIRESNETIDVSLPFLRQARRLVSRDELRGLARDLRPTAPPLARLTQRTPALYERVRAAAGCENDVIDPWANDRVSDPTFPATGKVFEEAPKPLPGLAGESRNGDANGQWVHVLTSAGDRTHLARQRHVRAGAVPDPRHQPAQAGRRAAAACRRALRDPAAARPAHEGRARASARSAAGSRRRPRRASGTSAPSAPRVTWVERELKRRGLDRQLKVRP